jgi:hypothetical protein
MPEYPTYTEEFSLSMEIDPQDGEVHTTTATLMVNAKTYSETNEDGDWVTKEWVLPATDEVTTTYLQGIIPDRVVDGNILDDAYNYWGAGENYVTATIFYDNVVVGKVYQTVEIMPRMKWDSSVRNLESLRMGEVLSPIVSIRPLVNYISNTNEIVMFDYGNDKSEDVVITDTTHFVKDATEDKTKEDTSYVYSTMGMTYTKAGAYTLTAEYAEGVYSTPKAEATQMITVAAPMLDYMLQDPTGEDITTQVSGGPLVMKMDSSYALSPTVAWFYGMPVSDMQAPPIQAQVMVSGTDAMTNVTAPMVNSPVVTYVTGVAMLSSVYGEEDPEDLPAGMQLPEGMKLVSMSKPITLEVNGTIPCKVASIDLSAMPAAADRPINVETGGQYTVTATLKDEDGNGVSGEEVTFTTQGGGAVNPASGTGDEDGIVTTYVSSSEAATVTLQAMACMDGEDTTPVTATLEGLTFYEELGWPYDPAADFEESIDDITIFIPQGAYANPLRIRVIPVEGGNPPEGVPALTGPTVWQVFKYYQMVITDMDGNVVNNIQFTKTQNVNGIKVTIQFVTGAALQAPVTVPATATQLLKVGNYTGNWSSQPANVSGNTMSVEMTSPGSALASLTAAREVYLPLIAQMDQTSPTTSTLGF